MLERSKTDVVSFLVVYKSVMFTNALSEYFIGMSCAFLSKRGQHIFCEVNSNGRCLPFVCCICFVKLPCLSRYIVDCSVWNVSCMCVCARLYFVTEDDLLKSSFAFFLATSRQLFHFIHAIQLHRQYLSCVKFHAFAMFGKTVYNVIKRFWQRLFSAILDSLWGLLKATFEPSWQPFRSFS